MSAALSDPVVVVAVTALVVIGYLAFVMAAIRDSLLMERRYKELAEEAREIAEEIKEDE